MDVTDNLAYLDDFERDGFIVIRNMYTDEEIAQLSSYIDALVALPTDKQGAMVYLEDSLLEKDKRILSRIEHFVEVSPGLHDFVYAERLTSVLANLLQDTPVLFKEKVNFKRPGGGGFEPHQDVQPGWDNYCPYFISVLVTIDESTLQNGCLELASGHHKKGQLGKSWEPLTPSQLTGIAFTPYEMKPGDVAFFGCFVPHQSKPNLTDKQRRNLYLTYNRLSDGDHRRKYFDDKRKSFPPDAEREPGKQYVFKV